MRQAVVRAGITMLSGAHVDAGWVVLSVIICFVAVLSVLLSNSFNLGSFGTTQVSFLPGYLLPPHVRPCSFSTLFPPHFFLDIFLFFLPLSPLSCVRCWPVNVPLFRTQYVWCCMANSPSCNGDVCVFLSRTGT